MTEKDIIILYYYINIILQMIVWDCETNLYSFSNSFPVKNEIKKKRW